MTAETALENINNLSKRLASIRFMANAIAEVTNYQNRTNGGRRN